MKSELDSYIEASIQTKDRIINDLEIKRAIVSLSSATLETLQKGGKVIFCGNGGSFADAQHLATEFVSKLMFERDPLPAIALGTNSSNLSAIGNDYGFDHVFARELSVIGSSSDLFIPISTSGNSPNILKAVEVAKIKQIKTVALTGNKNGAISKEIPSIKVPSDITAHIQECHIMIGHFICKFVEERYFER